MTESKTRTGRPRSCMCDECPKCKHAAYMREWWRSLSPDERREKIRRRDPEQVRRGLRERNRKRKESGTPDQQLKMRSRTALERAVYAGRITKGACERAGGDCSGRIEGHHDDYEKPLDVRWLCQHHHLELHGLGAK